MKGLTKYIILALVGIVACPVFMEGQSMTTGSWQNRNNGKTETVQIVSNPTDAEIYVDGQKKGTGNVSLSLSDGPHDISVQAKKYKTFSGTVRAYSGMPGMIVNLKRMYQQKNSMYVKLWGQYGSLPSLGLSFGGYIYNFNIEACSSFGLKSSEYFDWTNEEGFSPAVYRYSPVYNGLKLGYGIIAGSRLRFTPRVGIGAVRLNGKVIDPGYSDPEATDAFQINAQADLTVDVAINSWFGVYVSPSYSFALKSSSLYARLGELSPIVSKYGKGFNGQIGITMFF